MVIQAAQQDTGSTEARAAPLGQLSDRLGSDMLKVNALIMDSLHSAVPMIPQLAGYLIASGGKRIRPLLTLACTQLFAGDMNRAHGLATSVEFIHTATLLHDDVVDGSIERRGKKAANLVFGNQASVLVGDFLFSRAFQLMVKDGSLDVLRILSEASAIISQGEVMQLTIAGNLETNREDYIKVIAAKTAALFAAACEIGPVIAGADKSAQTALRAYGYNLGIAFQIADDVLDYNADQEKLGKTVGDDFREGKMTAPVILALEKATAEEEKFWKRTLADETQTEGDLKQAQEILKKHKALDQGITLAKKYAAKARHALLQAPDSNLRLILDKIPAFTIEREY